MPYFDYSAIHHHVELKDVSYCTHVGQNAVGWINRMPASCRPGIAQNYQKARWFSDRQCDLRASGSFSSSRREDWIVQDSPLTEAVIINELKQSSKCGVIECIMVIGQIEEVIQCSGIVLFVLGPGLSHADVRHVREKNNRGEQWGMPGAQGNHHCQGGGRADVLASIVAIILCV